MLTMVPAMSLRRQCSAVFTTATRASRSRHRVRSPVTYAATAPYSQSNRGPIVCYHAWIPLRFGRGRGYWEAQLSSARIGRSDSHHPHGERGSADLPGSLNNGLSLGFARSNPHLVGLRLAFSYRRRDCPEDDTRLWLPSTSYFPMSTRWRARRRRSRRC
jgi:hypothetical protein